MALPSLKLPDQQQRLIDWPALSGSADSLAIAQAGAEASTWLLVVTTDTHSALRLEREIPFFLTETIPVIHFPDWETLPYDIFSPLSEIVSKRLQTLYQIHHQTRGILIVPVSTLLQRLSPHTSILAQCFQLELGDTLNLDQIRRQLDGLGYQSVSNVHQHGEFSIRGAILDLFPMGHATPFRIELFDQEVESIRTFDVESQCSIDKVPSIRLFPAREFPMDDVGINSFRNQFRDAFPNISNRNTLYQDVSKGLAPAGIEYYLPLFVESTECLLDYLPDATVIRHGEMEAAAAQFLGQANQRYQQRLGDIERPVLSVDQLFMPLDELLSQLDPFPGVQLNYQSKPNNDEPALLQPTHNPPDLALKQLLQTSNHRVLFMAESAGHRESMLSQLQKHQIRPKAADSWKSFLASDDSPQIIVGPVDHSIELADISLITEDRLLGHRAQQRRRRKQSASREFEHVIRDLTELEVGAPVIHQEHGVGRYQGLQRLEVGGVDTEFLMLSYAQDDKLYVPVASLNCISRYTGASPDTAPLHKLGSGQWEKARKKAISRIRDVAAELLDIHARRAARLGQSLETDSEDYDRFARDFPFEETADQATAIEQTLADQASKQPMDRVICGDVGFGKTEVAMRAAFIATQNNTQVAVLVPTTLLAQQHHQNFSDRFADWPVRVEVLSRFVTRKQQEQIISDVANGKVDILIGTHKLLQKSVRYKQLGLVIIDEEQRFGVRHKEYFKSLRSEVDVLTLTATPIPRTLNMALSGLRDISIIASPPPNRHAIQTFVTQWHDPLIQEACLREIKRGGQVFFLHNDIDSMPRIEADLARLIPEARIQHAHGQMRERELEQIMLDFYHQRFNILVCTTIIENGIDLPSANTILINRADKLGLSQLHQLRGRVGRSHHRAYAYMIVPPPTLMTADAKKRIAAIEASDGLGAGFTLSTHDMEIRGAGELLGDDQSGEIQEIGYTLYTELLERAVAALKSGQQPELDAPLDHGPEIDLQLTALIPDDYLPDVHLRLVMYKRIANAQHEDELRDLQIEMIDRFGLLPAPVQRLFSMAELKLLAAAIGVEKLDAGAKQGRVIFKTDAQVDSGKIIELIQRQSNTYKLDGPDKLRFIKNFDSDQQKIDFVQTLLNDISIK